MYKNLDFLSMVLPTVSARRDEVHHLRIAEQEHQSVVLASTTVHY